MLAQEAPHILCCADEHYARPLAAMVQSLLEHTPGPLTLTVVDAGFRASTRERLTLSWDGLDVRWVQPSYDRLEDLPVSGHASVANYVRLLAADLLPASLERVLYLDVDLLVLTNLTELWHTPFDGALALAAQDVSLPWIDAALQPDFERRRPYVKVPEPIRNYRELGLDGRGKYLNSGVLLIDLAAWREEDLAEQFLRCVQENREHLRLWDQYVLNVVLAGRWSEIHPTWNGQIQVLDYPGWQESPYDEATHEQVIRTPKILHFAAHVKPWQYDWPYPHADRYFEYLDRTPYAGWRPRRWPFDLDRKRWIRSFLRRSRRRANRKRIQRAEQA